jgi:hypothetical protein
VVFEVKEKSPDRRNKRAKYTESSGRRVDLSVNLEYKEQT